MPSKLSELVLILVFTFSQHLDYCKTATFNNPYRLPNSIVPYHYEVNFKPDFYWNSPKDFMLYGSTIIHATAVSETMSIKVHAVNLTLTNKIKVIQNDKNLDILANYTYSKVFQWFVLNLSEALKEDDDISIHFINYTRPIDHSYKGIIYYTRTDKYNTIYGVYSQLEPVFARYAFPCFDEPHLKAKFNISICRKETFTALSNNRMLFSDNNDNTCEWILDVFEETPIMSTYLVAVVVTQYASVSAIISNVTFTFLYPPSVMSKDSVNFAMKVAKKAFPAMQEYFDYPFPLSKMDNIGFRDEDYLHAGMENLGLLTYYDNFFYNDPGNSKDRDYASIIILHEMIHQWIGNIVTMKWWNDLWVKEAITEFLSSVKGAWQFEDLNIRLFGEQFVLEQMTAEVEKVRNPLYIPLVRTPKEIEETLPLFAYGKGAMIMQMTEQLMEEETFKKSIRYFIKKNAYKSVTHQDLFDTITLAMKEDGKFLDIIGILTPWVMQSGYPLVTVKINYVDKIIHYQQELFPYTHEKRTNISSRKMFMNISSKKSRSKKTWPIPLQWKTKYGLSHIQVRGNERGSVKMYQRLEFYDWIIVNPEAHFYYIVNYEKKHWEHLGRHLERNHTNIDVYSRTKLIYDILRLYAATRSRLGDYVTTETVIKFLRFTKHETEKTPLKFLKLIKKAKMTELMPILKNVN